MGAGQEEGTVWLLSWSVLIEIVLTSVSCVCGVPKRHSSNEALHREDWGIVEWRKQALYQEDQGLTVWCIEELNAPFQATLLGSYKLARLLVSKERVPLLLTRIQKVQ